MPLSNLALIGAGVHDAGAASAMLNATQQVGASIGTALLATLSVGAITNYFTDVALVRAATRSDPAVGLEAQVEGYTTAFTWAVGAAGARRPRLRRADQGHQGGPARRGRGPRGKLALDAAGVPPGAGRRRQPALLGQRARRRAL